MRSVAKPSRKYEVVPTIPSRQEQTSKQKFPDHFAKSVKRVKRREDGEPHSRPDLRGLCVRRLRRRHRGCADQGQQF